VQKALQDRESVDPERLQKQKRKMKKTKIIYWTSTSLFAFMMFGSAIPDVMMQEVAIKGMHDGLGYPIYFVPFIGVAKVLGVIALFVPGFPRVREWAYAGLFFDLTGAAYSCYVMGERGAGLLFMALPAVLGIFSYVYHHRLLRSYDEKRNFDVALQANVGSSQ
jgi:hypothetical protein